MKTCDDLMTRYESMVDWSMQSSEISWNGNGNKIWNAYENGNESFSNPPFEFNFLNAVK